MGEVREAEHGRPTHRLVHLSDTHLVGAGRLYGQLDAEARLQQILEEMLASQARVDALIFTGDLADRGERQAYTRLHELVAPVATELGAQVIWVMGNHDDRANFRAEFLPAAPGTGAVDYVYDLDGLRVVTLDTTVPGHHHGEIDEQRLQWLAAQLATPAPHGTILAMHHPPIPCVQDLAVLVELREQTRLARVLRGTDVRAILAGHLHYSTSATFAGIPVSVVAATCYTQDLNAPVGAQRGRDGAQSSNLVHVYPDTIVHSVVPIGTYATVGEAVSADETARRLREAGIRIPGAPLLPT
ncbi:3',5'-cyclic adenosine monophosphate phosphodiesterase CpdA [Mycolicibacterium chitae]|uniref:Class III cyclic nucleotide phosphodiesterase (cNMP PDE) n=1 Tax=Mycolicibacterium chitae TaxID=1792 RepID=A0A448I4L4_MYCCI|nr:phosphodiesterase [Mycolicibacterium chitae]MCV7106315.1 phosphodiesterase [Mycolicibacterium chitae]BBZ03771.1 3',5'-cyclic adenosine monophosphate phosphodiesterase CpdA [Mycolicibacterium chitae]VEG47426.1 Class III cyclic nucleotide phosphodiesterase (cNMP PDE) [Mycolicibacterium chitae]